MSNNLINSLSNEVKIWFAHAVAGLITADGIVTESELDFLREAIGFLEDVNDINKVVAMVKNKEKVSLQKLNTDHASAAIILIQLATIAITDGKLDPSEVEFFQGLDSTKGFDREVGNSRVGGQGRPGRHDASRDRFVRDVGSQFQPFQVFQPLQVFEPAMADASFPQVEIAEAGHLS